MLGLDTLYEIDQRLRILRGFQDRDFGGLPIVIFSGGFLQFGPIQQKGLLGDIERITEEDVRNKPNDRKMQRHWWQLMAKRLWENFDNVVKRAQGDPFLFGLLERIRANKRRKIWTRLIIPAMIRKRPWIFPTAEEPSHLLTSTDGI